MINYPPYMRDKFTKKLFRLGVIHRVLLENENTTHRIKLHAFGVGRHIGALEMCRSTWWRDKDIGTCVYEEAKRLWNEINEVKS